jgi:hypothetical protein
MIVFEDGSFHLDQGETVPFLCPCCGWPTRYDKTLTEVHCGHCGHRGTAAEFTEDQAKLLHEWVRGKVPTVN